MIKDPTLTVFPNLRLLIQIALTLPVTSNEAERSFSGMRKVFYLPGSEPPWAQKGCQEWLPTLIE